MKMNTLGHMIKNLPCFLVNFKAAINKKLLLTKCSKPTLVYVNKRFHLHYRELVLLQRILLIKKTTLFLKALEESRTFTVTKLTNCC